MVSNYSPGYAWYSDWKLATRHLECDLWRKTKAALVGRAGCNSAWATGEKSSNKGDVRMENINFKKVTWAIILGVVIGGTFGFLYVFTGMVLLFALAIMGVSSLIAYALIKGIDVLMEWQNVFSDYRGLDVFLFGGRDLCIFCRMGVGDEKDFIHKGDVIMGNIYYAICHDCKECACLDKFWDWSPASFDKTVGKEALMECKDSEKYIDGRDKWVIYSILLHRFIELHNGHKIEVAHDNDPVIDYYRDNSSDGRSFFDDYRRVINW